MTGNASQARPSGCHDRGDGTRTRCPRSAGRPQKVGGGHSSRRWPSIALAVKRSSRPRRRSPRCSSLWSADPRLAARMPRLRFAAPSAGFALRQRMQVQFRLIEEQARRGRCCAGWPQAMPQSIVESSLSLPRFTLDHPPGGPHRTSARPTPVPGWGWSSSTRWKGVKMRSRSSSGTPGPLSLTVSCQHPSCAVRWTSTGPWDVSQLSRSSAARSWRSMVAEVPAAVSRSTSSRSSVVVRSRRAPHRAGRARGAGHRRGRRGPARSCAASHR